MPITNSSEEAAELEKMVQAVSKIKCGAYDIIRNVMEMSDRNHAGWGDLEKALKSHIKRTQADIKKAEQVYLNKYPD